MAEPGAGKYADEIIDLFKKENCEGVVLIVFGGKRGGGFGVASVDPKFQTHLPRLLREMADEIEGAPRCEPRRESLGGN